MREPAPAEVEQLARMLRWQWAIGMGRGRHLVRDVIEAWRKQCERAERKEGRADGRVGE